MAVEQAMPPLRVDELVGAFECLMRQVRAQFGDEVDLHAVHVDGYYWTLACKDAYTLADDPQRLCGDVADDLDEVRNLLAREEGEVFLWHDLDHFTGLLRAIAFLDLPS